jgi:DNA polymerase III gamma/tau subunit
MKLEIDVNIRFDQREAPRWAKTLHDMVSQILENQESTIMPTIDELQAKAAETLAQVTAETDLDNAIAKIVTDQNTTIADLKAQLAAAGTDPQKLQQLAETMDAILATNTSNTKIVTDAVTANTPAA